MTDLVHKTYVASMVFITVVTTLYLGFKGYSYYALPIEERFYHPQYDWFKPSGILGQGLGILGTFMIFFGVFIYIARKRYNVMARYIRLKYLLEFHIFLCFLGSILVMYHTSFKFGGLVSIAFWSMVAVVLSGFIGRFIYVQIPRTIEGRELSLKEVQGLRLNLNAEIQEYQIESIKKLMERANQLNSLSPFNFIQSKFLLRKIYRLLDEQDMDPVEKKKARNNIRTEIALAQRIDRLQQMKKLFKYWHIAHLPFALIMLFIVIIHVIVTISLGYKWLW